MMREERIRRLPMALSALVALALTVVPLPLALDVLRPDFLVLVVFYWSIASPRAGGLGLAFFSGLALDVINASIESAAKLRRLQYEGEEEARSMQKKAVRHAAEASDPQALMAASQAVTQEAVEKAMQYWGQMFDMIVEIQKRLFTLIEQQMADMPGAKEAKAALSMMPDISQTQNLVKAMQGVMSSGGSAFDSMQRVMGDFARMAQQSIPGVRR